MTTLNIPTVARPSRLRWRWSHHFEILIVSFSALVIEISYTRIVSYKLFYYYVYLVIGLALLGIGGGGVVIAVSKRLKRAATDQILFWSLVISSIGTVAAYVLIAFVRIDTLAVWQYGTTASTRSFLMLLVISVSIFASFVGPGIIIATLFGRQPEGIGGLYFADLLGAGIGCATVIYFVSSLGAPAAVMLAALAMGVCALWVAVRLQIVLRVISVLLVIGTTLLVAFPGALPYQRVDTSKISVPPGDLAFSGWGSIFRVDAGVFKKVPDQIYLYHDGILGSSIYKWNGKLSFLKIYDFPQDPRAIPFDVLKTPPQQEAVIGAAGAHEVLVSLAYKAGHIDAVELNPVTVHLVTTTFANFDGHIAQNPHVTYYVADGRSYMARTSKKFQLVWYPAPDSYAATNGALSSAYVLSESYLYTTNGIESDLQHLTINGTLRGSVRRGRRHLLPPHDPVRGDGSSGVGATSGSPTRRITSWSRSPRPTSSGRFLSRRSSSLGRRSLHKRSPVSRRQRRRCLRRRSSSHRGSPPVRTRSTRSCGPPTLGSRTSMQPSPST